MFYSEMDREIERLRKGEPDHILSREEREAEDRAVTEARYQRQRERLDEEKATRNAEVLAAKVETWNRIHSAIKSYTTKASEAATVQVTCQLGIEKLEEQRDQMVAEGFVPPAPIALPVVAEKPKAPVAAKPVAYEPAKPTTEVCEVCGQLVKIGIAYHRFPEGDFQYCIRDVQRARHAGLNSVVIADNLERQAVAKGNA